MASLFRPVAEETEFLDLKSKPPNSVLKRRVFQAADSIEYEYVDSRDEYFLVAKVTLELPISVSFLACFKTFNIQYR